jgi:hypothetical protein
MRTLGPPNGRSRRNAVRVGPRQYLVDDMRRLAAVSPGPCGPPGSSSAFCVCSPRPYARGPEAGGLASLARGTAGRRTAAQVEIRSRAAFT